MIFGSFARNLSVFGAGFALLATATPALPQDGNDEARLREAIELLYFGYREFTAGPDRILAERGLSRTHHRILYFIGRNEAVSVSELLAILAVTKQALHGPLFTKGFFQLLNVQHSSRQILSREPRDTVLRRVWPVA